ncbi:hypothetical protein OBBRIDRAFT_830240 [Obba rivulosa]|uniref:ATP-dependent DNA ligase family profile domain-containing protein n=1 Tax=Obba rivulosa TaxID=1052685 RepID=A0A8E2J7A5_9APHY|nr:hypothetical protein OBBRIDRAFT_830240 [Obba rivulosa]
MATCTSSFAINTAVPFAFFVSLIEAIGDIRSRNASGKGHRKTSSPSVPVVQTFKRWVAELQRRHTPIPPGTTAAVFRMLFPQEDVRRKYGMQETRLAQYIAKILGVSTAPHARGARLANWTAEDAKGCLGAEVKYIMEGTFSNPSGPMSIVEVDTLLTELASTCAFSASTIRPLDPASPRPRDKQSILSALYARLSPIEAAVVTQIILKDMRPLLYPIPEGATHYTTALRQFNSNAVMPLKRDDAMRIWDPSGRTLFAYRVRTCFEEAALAFECGPDDDVEQYLVPRVGSLIQIPKCAKGQGCARSLELLKDSDIVWAETKYDGERTQIHVQLEPTNAAPKITIYSKSGRDSTLDRFAVHSVICDALGLSALSTSHSTPKRAVKRNIILEAEMVAFSDTLNRIDEFWRIRSLIASTAIGVRHKEKAHISADSQTDEDCSSQCSMISNGSDGGTRHLALVFFDILFLDDTSLLSRPYSERRALLESVVAQIPGRAMFAERAPIPLVDPSSGRPLADPAAALREVFARIVASHEEGLVLKADHSRYNDWKFPWVKLKKDYIPGHGDAVDLVLVGAVWEKDRARELRVPPTAYTTFYIGALANSEELKKNPHFEVYFTASYGLSREQLEELNFMIKSSDAMEYSPKRRLPGMSYTLNIFKGLQPPAVLLRTPILAEVTSGSFSKAEHCLFYESRFPRITKIFRSGERTWADGTTLTELQRIARESVGRNRPNKDVDTWAAALFQQPSSPDVRCPVKRKRNMELWLGRFEEVDRKEGGKRRKTGNGRIQASPREAEMASEHLKEPVGQPVTEPIAPVTPRLRALGSVTNIARASVPQEAATTPSRALLLQDTFSRSSMSPMAALPRTPTRTIHSPSHINQVASSPTALRTPISVGRRISAAVTDNASTSEMNQAVRSQTASSQDLNIIRPEAKPTQSQTTGNASELMASPMGVFLKSAFVWLARPHNTLRPSWRAPARAVIPAGQQVSTLDALLRACGWCETGPPVCDWVEYGVIFVDNEEEGAQWTEYPLKTLLQRCAALDARGDHARCKPVWVFSMRMLGFDELRNVEGDIKQRAICRVGGERT